MRVLKAGIIIVLLIYHITSVNQIPIKREICMKNNFRTNFIPLIPLLQEVNIKIVNVTEYTLFLQIVAW